MSSSRVYGDWGSSQLRLWRMRDGEVFDRRSGPGIVGLERPAGEVLREALAPWLAEPLEAIRLCGMAGARGGLHEVPYGECPIDVAGWRRASLDLAFDGMPLRIGAGVATAAAGVRCEVMRGEECQVFGAMRLHPQLRQGRHAIVHPGTHSKWIDVDGGRITGFRTYFTGELFALLQHSSLLAAGGGGDGSEAQGFAAGLDAALNEPGVLGSLFQARAAQVRGGRGPDWARGFLSGLLIGGEAIERQRSGPLPASVLLIGERRLTDRYAEALSAAGVATETAEGDACVLAGLELLDAVD